MNKISLAIVVSERTGINPALCCFYQQGGGPWTSGILRLHHVDPEVWMAVVGIEVVIGKSNRWRPNAVSMLRSREDVFRWLALQRMPNDSPVNEIFRMKDR